MKILITRRW